MSRPSAYIAVIRTFFVIVFVAGSFVHLYGGLTSPQSYAAFGETAWPPLDAIWAGFVMPNIGWLPFCMAAFELGVGLSACLPGWWNRLAVTAMTCFLAFITVLGYAFPTRSSLEDFFINRAFSLVMILLVTPWLLQPQQLSVRGAWFALLRQHNDSEIGVQEVVPQQRQ